MWLAVLSCAAFLVGLPASVSLKGSPLDQIDSLPATAAAEEAAPLSVVVRGAPEGNGLPGASVRVFWVQGDRYFQVGVSETDATGAVRFENLPRGAVWVLVEADGRARASSQLVVAGEPRELVFDLEPANLLRVKVQDESGAPVPGATVLVSGPDALPFGAVTDESGSVDMTRLGASPWRVRVAARGFDVVARKDVVSDITITLERLGSVEVATVDGSGKPVGGAIVWIAGSSLWPARRVATDEGGKVRITGLADGAYDLKATKGQLVSRTHVGRRLERGKSETVTLVLMAGRQVEVLVTDGEGENPVVVSGADVLVVEEGISSFPLRRRTSSLGKVTLGPVTFGPVLVGARADGFVPRSTVAVLDEETDVVRLSLLKGAILRGEVVDEAGYAVDGASVEVIGTDFDGRPIAETPMHVAFRRSHFEWALSATAPLMPAGELGVMPGLIPPIPGGSHRSTALAAHIAQAPDPWVTGYDGRFVAKPVPPGRVRALVRHPEYVEAISDPVRLGPGGEGSVRVVLAVGGAVEGRLLSEAGLPVAGARIDAIAVVGSLERTTLTASDGTFAFAALPSQVVFAVARPEDLSKLVLRERIAIGKEGRTEVEVIVPEVREPVTAEVVDADDQPIELAQVTALSLDPGLPLRETRFSNEDGHAEIADARGLDLRWICEAPGFSRTTTTTSDTPETVRIVLSPGVIVEGRVTKVRGRRAAVGVRVTLAAGGDRLVRFTDEQGAYRFEDVRPGLVELGFSGPELASKELEVEVTQPSRTDRPFEVPEVDLEEPGRVSGRVVDERGEPVSGARVAVGFVPAYLPLGALPDGMAATRADGVFELEGLSPGSVELQAYAADVGRGRAEDIVIDAGQATSGVEIVLVRGAEEDEPASTGSVAVTLGEHEEDGDVYVVIVSVAEGSEAERAGLAAGDFVLDVEGQAVDGMGQARALLSGPEGSDVVVTLFRDDAERSLRVRRERVRR